MGSMMIAVGVELTCYYYSFLFATTFLYSKRKEAGAILLGVTAMTGFIDWAPTKYLPSTGPLANLRISQWLDEQYMLMSVVTLVGFVWIMYLFAVESATPDAQPIARSVAVARASHSSGGRSRGDGSRGNKQPPALALRSRSPASRPLTGYVAGRAVAASGCAPPEMKKAAGG